MEQRKQLQKPNRSKGYGTADGKKLSQKALAEQLQLAGYEFSDLTVLRIEKGTRFVPDYEVVALAEFFHVSCEYLLGVQGKK